MAKIIIIFDKLIRPDTTGIYCEDAIRNLGHEVIHFAPLSKNESGEFDFNGYEFLPQGGDLYLQIDDDIGYPGPDVEGVSAYWCIDSHRMHQMLGGGNRIDKARAFNHVFVAQKDGAQVLNGHWLPLAFHSGVMRYLPGSEKSLDWCFVGAMKIGDRKQILKRVARHFPNGFAGTAWGEDMNLIYNKSRLILNISISNDINMRLFEGQATGTPVLTNRLDNGEDELFDSLLYYRNLESLLYRMENLLKTPQRLNWIGKRQMGHVLSRHTYEKRMADLLAACGIA